MQAVYDVAEATGLFAVGDIKVRLCPYKHFKLGPGKKGLHSHFRKYYGRQEHRAESEPFKTYN
jgi:hypothetical protein